MLKKTTAPPKPAPKAPQVPPLSPAPPVYRPTPAQAMQPRNSVPTTRAGVVNPRVNWPPVYRPGTPTPQTGTAPQPLRAFSSTSRPTPAGPLQTKPAAPPAPPVYRPVQANSGPSSASIPLRSSVKTRIGTIQRAKTKMDLEDEINDAMANQDWERVDELDAEMAELPGDSAQKFGINEEDVYDLTYKNKQVRFTFAKGLRAKLIAAQTSGGKLHCALGVGCFVSKATGSDEIELNKNGKEEWVSVSGKTHETAPPIDHYLPDWKDRLNALMKMKLDVANFKIKGEALYNALPLRIIHMTCNSKRNGG